MKKNIKDMTLEEFHAFVGPSMIATVKGLDAMGEDSELLDILAQVIRMAEHQTMMALVYQMTKMGDAITAHGIYTTLFLLGMLCEREGWYLEDSLEDT